MFAYSSIEKHTKCRSWAYDYTFYIDTNIFAFKTSSASLNVFVYCTTLYCNFIISIKFNGKKQELEGELHLKNTNMRGILG
jgi:hypothetical protein